MDDGNRKTSCPAAAARHLCPGAENFQALEILVGRLGALPVEPGFYVYVGSAFGPGGLERRVGRHATTEKKHRWHIDYLTAWLHSTRCGTRRTRCAGSASGRKLCDRYAGRRCPGRDSVRRTADAARTLSTSRSCRRSRVSSAADGFDPRARADLHGEAPGERDQDRCCWCCSTAWVWWNSAVSCSLVR